MTPEEQYVADFDLQPIPDQNATTHQVRRYATHRAKKRFENGWAVEVVAYLDGGYTYFIYKPDGFRMTPTNRFVEHIERWERVTSNPPETL